MPQISEITDAMTPMQLEASEESSLQVSTTSPEVVAASHSRALQVRKSNTKGSGSGSRTSSNSSSSGRPPIARSHRGQGSEMPIRPVQLNQQLNQHAEIHEHDQRSVHVLQQEVHQHDQRTVVVDNRSLQVGIDPIIAQQREDALRGEAIQVVSQLQSQNQQLERSATERESALRAEALGAVSQLQSEKQQLERNASQAIHQIESSASTRMNQMEQSFILQLSQADETNRQLMQQLELQSQQIEEQKQREEELRNIVMQMQNQLVVAKHAPPTIAPVVRESRNGADDTSVDVAELMNDVRQLREELRVMKQISSVPVATYAMTPNASHVQLPQPIAPPALSPVSACAGFPPSGSGTPRALKVHSSDRDFWSMSTPTGGSNFPPKGSIIR